MNTLSAYQRQTDMEICRPNLKAGMWIDGGFDWYDEDEHEAGLRSNVKAFSQSYMDRGISFMKFTVSNRSRFTLKPKIVFRYENVQERQAVAFYSPNEQAILHIGQQGVAMLGGMMLGKGMSQYCIQGKGSLYLNGCFKSLQDGILLFSPLAKGEVTSIFSLETEIKPFQSAEATAWIIHTDTKEEGFKQHAALLSGNSC